MSEEKEDKYIDNFPWFRVVYTKEKIVVEMNQGLKIKGSMITKAIRAIEREKKRIRSIALKEIHAKEMKEATKKRKVEEKVEKAALKEALEQKKVINESAMRRS